MDSPSLLAIIARIFGTGKSVKVDGPPVYVVVEAEEVEVLAEVLDSGKETKLKN